MATFSSPYEILVGPVWVYYAPTGEAFPSVDTDPVSGNWLALGETDEGVTVQFGQSIEEHRSQDRTGVLKASRSEESPVVTASLLVATLENMAPLFGTTVDEVAAGAGTPGTKTLPLYRGVDVTEYAFLLRGKSAYGDYPAQYELPRAYVGGEPEFVHNKEGHVAIEIEIHVMEDMNAATEDERHGRLVMQHEPAT